MPDNMEMEIRYLKGIGPKRAESFRAMGIEKIADLISHFPRTYEDRSVIKKINEMVPGEKATVHCTVSNVQSRRIRRNLHILKAVIFDGTGYINVTWFNQDYYYKKLSEGKEFWFYGRLEMKRNLEMTNPVFSSDFEEFAVIVPIYRKNQDLSQYIIRTSIKNALSTEELGFNEIFPGWILRDYDLTGYETAIRNIHFPIDNGMFYKARKRLVFQELFMMQVSLLKLKSRHRKDEFKGKLIKDHSLGDRYIESLGFQLTSAQKRVIDEIRSDFVSKTPMHRLVQGDVGSGKTAVAAAAIADVCKNGYQAAFMAPTEILARQHYDSLKEAFGSMGMTSVYLGGELKLSEKKAVQQEIRDGSADVIIGTHALIQRDVEFNNLGLVITDEQHRFGVEQRKNLMLKGSYPHSLVLTATPIPRTLALILYGDLDISVIDEMPPGRKKIDTYAISPDKRKRLLDFAGRRMKEGAQVYYVCPRIEEDDDSGLVSAEEIYRELSAVYKDYKVDYIHGRMKTAEKDEKMKSFYDGNTDMLISTTVIEVGVNVPNATLMIIDNAERFGLAQLHQLRGRVGRGSEQSYCVMINRGTGSVAARRMKIMSESTDGFYISEQDLKLRGPGEFFGTRQHGLPEFRIANIYQDMETLKKAQDAALRLLRDDPELIKPENASIMIESGRLLDATVE